jgi:hypothetical protein
VPPASAAGPGRRPDSVSQAADAPSSVTPTAELRGMRPGGSAPVVSHGSNSRVSMPNERPSTYSASVSAPHTVTATSSGAAARYHRVSSSSSATPSSVRHSAVLNCTGTPPAGNATRSTRRASQPYSTTEPTSATTTPATSAGMRTDRRGSTPAVVDVTPPPFPGAL